MHTNKYEKKPIQQHLDKLKHLFKYFFASLGYQIQTMETKTKDKKALVDCLCLKEAV